MELIRSNSLSHELPVLLVWGFAFGPRLKPSPSKIDRVDKRWYTVDGRFVWVVMFTHLRILGIFFAYKCLSHQDFHPNGSGLANVRQHRMKKELFRWGNAVRMGWKWVKPTDAFPCPLLNQFGPNFSDGWIIVKDDPIDWSPSWSLGRALCFSWPQPTSKWLSGRLSSSSWDLWFF